MNIYIEGETRDETKQVIERALPDGCKVVRSIENAEAIICVDKPRADTIHHQNTGKPIAFLANPDVAHTHYEDQTPVTNRGPEGVRAFVEGLMAAK